MTEQEIKKARERCEKATPGPWKFGSSPAFKSTAFYVDDSLDDRMICECWEGDDNTAREADAQFIAHARTDLPLALNEIKRLRAVLNDLMECRYVKQCEGCSSRISKIERFK